MGEGDLRSVAPISVTPAAIPLLYLYRKNHWKPHKNSCSYFCGAHPHSRKVTANLFPGACESSPRSNDDNRLSDHLLGSVTSRIGSVSAPCPSFVEDFPANPPGPRTYVADKLLMLPSSAHPSSASLSTQVSTRLQACTACVVSNSPQGGGSRHAKRMFSPGQ